MTLMSLSEEQLRRELRRRVVIGLCLLLLTTLGAFVGARLVLTEDEGVEGLSVILGVLGAKMVFVTLVVYWFTRPFQERTRRRRLVIRQALGTFPEEQP